MTKPFLALLTIALILGAALGGAFVGGIVLGKSQSANGEQTAGPGRVSAGPGAGFGGQRGGQTGRDGAAAARQGSGPQGQGPQGSGSPAQGSPARAESSTDFQRQPVPGGTAAGRQEGQASAQPSGQPSGSGNGPQSAPGSGQPPVGGPGRGGVAGTIESVDGEKLTINHSAGSYYGDGRRGRANRQLLGGDSGRPEPRFSGACLGTEDFPRGTFRQLDPYRSGGSAGVLRKETRT